MAPGERNKFGVPVFEPEVFRKQMYSFEKSAYDIVVTEILHRLPIKVAGGQGRRNVDWAGGAVKS